MGWLFVAPPRPFVLLDPAASTRRRGEWGSDPAITDAASVAYSPLDRSKGSPGHLQINPGASFARSSLARIIIATVDSAGSIARRLRARHREGQEAKAIYDALRDLDDHSLHDLGFDRSEITSVATEMTGQAETTRVRVALTSYGLPI